MFDISNSRYASSNLELANPLLLKEFTVLIAYLLLISLGIVTIWLGFKIAEEVYQIALISTGVLTVTWGFAIAPAEVQIAVEALSLGGLIRWRLR